MQPAAFHSQDSYLNQEVDQPTRITETTANILDLFFTNNQTLINIVEVIPGISDHEVVFIESSLRLMRVKIPPKKVNIYKKANYNNMKAELKALEVDFCSSAATKEVEELWTIFKTHVHSLIEKHIPSKMLRGNKIHKPWISKQVKALIHRRNKLFQRQKKSNSQKDIKLYKEAKAKLQRAERQSYW